MSASRLTAIVACWNCCHSPASFSIGCATRAANIWNATSMPTVKSGPCMTSHAPAHSTDADSVCSSTAASVW